MKPSIRPSLERTATVHIIGGGTQSRRQRVDYHYRGHAFNNAPAVRHERVAHIEAADGEGLVFDELGELRWREISEIVWEEGFGSTWSVVEVGLPE